MNLLVAVLLFVIGLVLIVKGGDFFVDAASWIAEVSGIPKFIVGATVVSLATTLPEMIVSLLAADKGSVDMAIGNAVGSVTANTGLILGISLVFMAGAAKRKDFFLKSAMLIAAASVLCLASASGSLKVWGSIMLLAIFILFMAENVHSAMGTKGAFNENERPPHDGKTVTVNILKFVFGAAGIVIGSDLMVDNATIIASALGVSEGVIAVTIVAVGTSLPELVTTITSIVKKQASLSVGNIIGANIIDLTLILPLCSLVSGKELPVSRQGFAVDMPSCLIVTLIALLPMLIKEKFTKFQGAVLLAAYAVYLVVVI